MSEPQCRLSEWFPGETCDHLYRDCRNLRGPVRPWKARFGWVDPHGGDICGMCLHRHDRTEHK